ncbi:MAG: cytidine deaminase [Candidatus Thermochlorobacter sp.]
MKKPHALLDAAAEAMMRAIAPYSGFKVGAALQTKDGKIITGHNIETSSYSLTICAERVALFKALSEGEREFEAIAIVASSGDFCPPCGACRQTLIDFAPHLVVYLSNRRGQVKTFKLSDLLPESFSSANLSSSFSQRSNSLKAKSNSKNASTNSNTHADATTTSQAKSKARSSKGAHRKN